MAGPAPARALAPSGFLAIVDRVESNGVKVVIVERADRLARDLMVSEVISREPPNGLAHGRAVVARDRRLWKRFKGFDPQTDNRYRRSSSSAF